MSISGEIINADKPSTTALERAIDSNRGGFLLKPVAAIEEILAAQQSVVEVIARCLKEGVDFGIVPGTKKNTLFKAGAERINHAFGVRAEPRIDACEEDHEYECTYTQKKWRNEFEGDKSYELIKAKSFGLYSYRVECILIHVQSGNEIGRAMGSCSTLESKYCDRPRECQNTVLKMAQKRALVAATLNAYGLSDRFTQDVEDFAEASSEQVAGMTVAQKVEYVSNFLRSKCKWNDANLKGFAAWCGDPNRQISWTAVVFAWINEKGGEVANQNQLLKFAAEFAKRPKQETTAPQSEATPPLIKSEVPTDEEIEARKARNRAEREAAQANE